MDDHNLNIRLFQKRNRIIYYILPLSLILLNIDFLMTFTLFIFTLPEVSCHESSPNITTHNKDFTQYQQKIPKLPVAPFQISLQEYRVKIPVEYKQNTSDSCSVGIPINPTTLVDFSGLMLIGNIGIGTPPQCFNVIFSTLVSNMWVASELCKKNCRNKHSYSRKKSKTYHENGSYFQIEYGNGAFAGELSDDDININGTTVKNQTFAEIAKITSQSGALLPYDGVIGLGFPGDSIGHVPTLLQGLVRQGVLNNFTFTMVKPSKDSFNRVLLFGMIEPAYYIGPITYVPTVSPNIWSFAIDRIDIEGKGIVCSEGCTAYANTGSPFIRGPPGDIKTINDGIGAGFGNEYYAFNCSDMGLLPAVVFVIGDRELMIDSNDYMLMVEFGDGSFLCVSAFVSTEKPYWDVGTAFVGSVYTQFDFGMGRIGFAPRTWV